MHRALAAATAVALGWLYFGWPDKVFVFDGVMFAFVIERNVLDVASALWNPRHLLFIPAFLGLRDALLASGRVVSGYALIQAVNALAGLAGVGVFAALVRRLTRRDDASFAAAALLGVTCAYWSRATEGQVYMLMTLGALATLWAALAFLDEPTRPRAWTLAGIWAAATLLHAADGFLFPVVAVALWRGDGRAPLACAAALVLGSYAWVFDVRGPSSALAFVRGATEFGGEAAGGGAFAREVAERLAGMPVVLVGAPAKLWEALAASSGWFAGFAGAAVLAALGVAAPRGRAAGLVAATGLIFIGLDAIWRGGAFFWAVPAACALALGAACVARRDLTPRERVIAAALVLTLAGWNFKKAIEPRSRLENNAGHAAATFVREHTAATGWVLTSGFGFPNSKVYLTQFSARNNSALEYYLREAPKPAALAKFGAHVAALTRGGLPVFALSDLIEDGPAAEALRRYWGATPAEIRAAFGPGVFLETARRGDDFAVYLFMPEDKREALFCGLAFNALDMGASPAAGELREAARRLAAAMTPAQRARAAALLRETRFGATLMLAAMRPHLSPERLVAAEAYAAGFMRRPTPEAEAFVALLTRPQSFK